MKNEKLLLIKELVVTQMNYWVLFTVAVTILGINGLERPSMWLWLLCGLVPFAFFLCRKYVTNVWLFILAHLVPVGVFVLLPSRNSVEKIVLVVMVAVAVGLSFYLRIRTEEQTDSPLHCVIAVGIIAAALWIQNYNGQQGWKVYYIGAVIVYIACYFVQYYIEQFFYFLIVNKNSNGNIPAKEILSNGMGMTLLYTGIGVLVLLITANIEWLAGIVGQIKRLFLWLLSFVLRDSEKQGEMSLEGAEEFHEEYGNNGLLEQLGLDVKTSKFLLILEKVFTVLLIVGFVALLIYLLRKLILIMVERFGKKVESKTVVLEHGVDVREKCEIQKPKAKRKKLPIFRNPSERIRNIYHKQVLAGKKQLIGELPEKNLGYMTAKECGDGLNQKILTVVYEKARYSSEESTMEDVRRLKAGI